MGDMVEAEQAPADFLFLRQVGQGVNLRITAPLDIAPDASATNLLCVSNARGLLFAATNEGFIVHKLKDARLQIAAAAKNTTATLTPWRTIATTSKLELGSRVRFLRVANQNTALAVGLESGRIAIWSLDQLESNAESQPQAVLQPPSSDLDLVEIAPNPSDRPELCAVLYAKKGQKNVRRASVSIYNVQSAEWQSEVKAPEGSSATCLAWSVRGKQLVIGLDNGGLAQATPEGELKDTLAKAQGLDNDCYVEHVLWLENNVFVVTYNAPQTTDEPEHQYEVFVLLRDTSSKTITSIRFDDPAPPFGDTTRHGHRYVSWLRTWEPMKHMLFMANTSSTDVGLLGCTTQGVGASAWQSLELEDTSRPALPFSTVDKGADTCPVGLEFDFSTEENVDDPLAAARGEDGKGKLDPVPILLIYTNDGVLLAYHVINTDAKAGKYKDPASTSASIVVSNSKSNPETSFDSDSKSKPDKSLETFSAPPASFGQPSTFGSTVSSPFSFKGSNTPTFGQSAQIGSAKQASPFGSFSNGSTNAFSSTTSSGGFGAFAAKASPGGFGVGTSSMTAKSEPAFAQPALHDSAKQTSPFGSNAAGSTSAFASSTKPLSGGFGAFASKSNAGGFGTDTSSTKDSGATFGQPAPLGKAQLPSPFGSSTAGSTPSASSSVGFGAFAAKAIPGGFGVQAKSLDGSNEVAADQAASKGGEKPVSTSTTAPMAEPNTNIPSTTKSTLGSLGANSTKANTGVFGVEQESEKDNSVAGAGEPALIGSDKPTSSSASSNVSTFGGSEVKHNTGNLPAVSSTQTSFGHTSAFGASSSTPFSFKGSTPAVSQPGLDGGGKPTSFSFSSTDGNSDSMSSLTTSFLGGFGAFSTKADANDANSAKKSTEPAPDQPASRLTSSTSSTSIDPTSKLKAETPLALESNRSSFGQNSAIDSLASSPLHFKGSNAPAIDQAKFDSSGKLALSSTTSAEGSTDVVSSLPASSLRGFSAFASNASPAGLGKDVSSGQDSSVLASSQPPPSSRLSSIPKPDSSLPKPKAETSQAHSSEPVFSQQKSAFGVTNGSPFSFKSSGNPSAGQATSNGSGKPAASSTLATTSSTGAFPPSTISQTTSQIRQIPQEDGLQDLYLRTYLTMEKELDALQQNVERCAHLQSLVRSPANATLTMDDLADPGKWTFGDLDKKDKLVEQLKQRVRELDAQGQSAKASMREVQSEQLKVEAKREEIARFLRARREPSLRKIIRVRQLGPEHSENQAKLRKGYTTLQQRIDEMDAHLAKMRETMFSERMGKAHHLKTPSLDSIRRAVRNMTRSAEAKLIELEELELTFASMYNTQGSKEVRSLAGIHALSLDDSSASPNGRDNDFPALDAFDKALPTLDMSSKDGRAQRSNDLNQRAKDLQNAFLRSRSQPVLNTRMRESADKLYKHHQYDTFQASDLNMTFARGTVRIADDRKERLAAAQEEATRISQTELRPVPVNPVARFTGPATSTPTSAPPLAFGNKISFSIPPTYSLPSASPSEAQASAGSSASFTAALPPGAFDLPPESAPFAPGASGGFGVVPGLRSSSKSTGRRKAAVALPSAPTPTSTMSDFFATPLAPKPQSGVTSGLGSAPVKPAFSFGPGAESDKANSTQQQLPLPRSAFSTASTPSSFAQSSFKPLSNFGDFSNNALPVSTGGTGFSGLNALQSKSSNGSPSFMTFRGLQEMKPTAKQQADKHSTNEGDSGETSAADDDEKEDKDDNENDDDEEDKVKTEEDKDETEDEDEGEEEGEYGYEEEEDGYEDESEGANEFENEDTAELKVDRASLRTKEEKENEDDAEYVDESEEEGLSAVDEDEEEEEE